MANRDIFSKHLPSVKLATRYDAEGREVQVERREDVDATLKEQETFNMLVAAGYYRAKIKGLSAFDKVVGGMTWCIECCDYGVDVDLLFHENLTIGQKIALVEKIVSVLPQMKCPYVIEPHQIQGLEFLSIHPVIQWLVKTSVENRTERAQRLKKFATSQFHNNYQYKTDRENLIKIHKASQHIKRIQEIYAPTRVYHPKAASSSINDERIRARSTLLEYGHRELKSDANKATTSAEETFENEPDVAQLLNYLCLTKKPVVPPRPKKLELDKRNALQEHYTEMKREMECGAKELSEQSKIRLLEAAESNLARKLQSEQQKTESLKKELDVESKKLENLQQEESKLQFEVAEFEKIEENADKDLLGNVQKLLKEHDDLKKEETEFKEFCRKDLADLESEIEKLQAFNAQSPEEKEASVAKEKGRIQELKLQIAKKNRAIVTIQRQLDAIPDPIELAQYQKRFLEVYNEMSAKHLETKQYYALYNTLNDQKNYLEKELSLLNSICDTYTETAKYSHGREQFLQQLEKAAESVRLTEAKVAQKYNEELQRRDALADELQALHDLQRQYAAAVKQLTRDCQRCEQLQQHLRSISGKP